MAIGMTASVCKVYHAIIQGPTSQFMVFALASSVTIIFAQTIAIILLVNRVKYSDGIVENMVHINLQSEYIRNHKYYHTKYEIGNGTYFDQLLLQGVGLKESTMKANHSTMIFDCAASIDNVKCSLNGNHHVWVEQNTVNIFRPYQDEL